MYCPGAILLGLITMSFANVIDLRISVDELSEHDPSTAADCFWSGTSPFCAGSCPSNYEDCRTDSCGDGACCWTGYKKYCCQGGCPNKKSLGGTIVTSSHDGAVHKTGGEHDDYCPEGEFICCPHHAKRNEECLCLPKKEDGNSRAAVTRSPRAGLQRALGEPDNDICDPSERICCPPDAEKNSQCRCYKP